MGTRRLRPTRPTAAARQTEWGGVLRGARAVCKRAGTAVGGDVDKNRTAFTPQSGPICTIGGGDGLTATDASDGHSRSSPSQGGLSKYSTRGTKHHMYASSPKKSIRGRRAKGTVLGPRGSSTPPYPDHRRACATPATPGAYHRRVVSPRALLVIPVVRCMCRLPTKNCPPDAPTALRVYAPL